MGDYTLTWVENGQSNTLYIRVSEDVANAFATALPAGCTDVKLTI